MSTAYITSKRGTMRGAVTGGVSDPVNGEPIPRVRRAPSSKLVIELNDDANVMQLYLTDAEAISLVNRLNDNIIRIGDLG